MDAQSRKANALFLIAFQYIRDFGAAQQASYMARYESPQAFLRIACGAGNPLKLKQDVLAALLSLNKAKPSGDAYRQAQVDYQRCEDEGWQLLTRFEPEYPSLLLQISKPPPLLYVRGDVRLLQQPALAMVGSRKASPGAERSAAALAKGMAQAGLQLVSGLAAGIDAAVHEGALTVGANTIAVIGTGLDRCYPQQNRALADKIAQSGVIVSEFRLNSSPIPGNFPRRNRIISGLSLGVVVVEAAERSGSLITARLALEQNREVFALPGAFADHGAAGANRLIQQGAKMVLGPQDILEELPGFLSKAVSQRDGKGSAPPLSPQQRLLLDAISYHTTSIELLCERAGLPAHEVIAGLAELELMALICSTAGGYQRLV